MRNAQDQKARIQQRHTDISPPNTLGRVNREFVILPSAAKRIRVQSGLVLLIWNRTASPYHQVPLDRIRKLKCQLRHITQRTVRHCCLSVRDHRSEQYQRLEPSIICLGLTVRLKGPGVSHAQYWGDPMEEDAR